MDHELKTSRGQRLSDLCEEIMRSGYRMVRCNVVKFTGEDVYAEERLCEKAGYVGDLGNGEHVIGEYKGIESEEVVESYQEAMIIADNDQCPNSVLELAEAMDDVEIAEAGSNYAVISRDWGMDLDRK